MLQYIRQDWYRGIQGFDTVPGQPNMLEGWIAGHEAEVMETVPDSVVKDICHELLAIFTGRPDLPQPTHISRSCWYSHPYTHGSYSYVKLGNTTADCDLLAEPLMHKQVSHLTTFVI